MKKSLLTVGLAVMSANVLGMNYPEQGERRFSTNMVSISELSERIESLTVNSGITTWWNDGLENGKDGFLKIIKEKKKKCKSRGEKIKAFNSKGSKHRNILMYAAENADVEIMTLLLDMNVIDINAKDIDGNTALLIASETGDIEKMRLLLSRGADVNAINNNGQTALSIVATSGEISQNKERLRLLFKYGATLDSLRNFENINELKSIQEEIEKERSALARIIQFTSNSNSSKRTPMSKSTLSTCINKIKNWGEINALITDFEKDRIKGSCSILLSAVKKGEAKLIRHLLENYPDININKKTSDGKTPLMCAIDLGYKDITEILLEKVKDVDVQDNRGLTALMKLISKLGDYPQEFKFNTWKSVVSKLVKKSENINVKNGKGITAWQLAVAYKLRDITASKDIAVARDIADEIMSSSKELQRDVAKNLFVSRDFESAQSILDKCKTVSVSTLTEEVLPGQSEWSLIKKENNVKRMRLYLDHLKDDDKEKEDSFRNCINNEIKSIEGLNQFFDSFSKKIKNDLSHMFKEVVFNLMAEEIREYAHKKIDDDYREALENLERWGSYHEEIYKQDKWKRMLQKREEANQEQRNREERNSSFKSAVRNNDLNQVQKLLLLKNERGEGLISQDIINEGFLLASENGSKEFVELLLDEVDINHKDPKTGNTALMLASQNGHLRVVGDLIANGATIDVNNNGYTALRFASENGHADVVEYLLDAGARTKYLDEILSKVKEKVAQNSSLSENYKKIQGMLSEKLQTEETLLEDVETKTWSIYFWNNATKSYGSLDKKLKEETDRLLSEIQKNPFERRTTPGQKPEPLYANLNGFFSRRINNEQRLVYRVNGGRIYVVACDDHYEDLNKLSKSVIRSLSSFNNEWKNNTLSKVEN